jgi:2'-5' RNA ligase
MKKRIFVAINISDNLKNEIKKFRQKYNSLPVRWMPDENLHLTLMPPTEFVDNEMVKMIEKFQPEADRPLAEKNPEWKTGAIKISFNRVSFGPDLRRPRLIWVKCEENSKLESLKNRMTDILGLRRVGRPNSFHLTIARFKPRDYANFRIKDLCEEVDWTEIAKSFNIIQSECLPEGARYTKLAEIKL